jgi:hypothetical protein
MLYSLQAKEPTATEMCLAAVYERVLKQLSNVINKHYAFSHHVKYRSQIFNVILDPYAGTISWQDFEETMLSLPRYPCTTEHLQPKYT